MEYTFCNDTFSDFFKEVNGFRPRGHHFDTASDDEKQKIWDDLIDDHDQKMADERQLIKDGICQFEDRIDDVIKLGAGNRKTALRWITGQEKFYHEQCVEHFVWELNVLFSDYGRNLIKEITEVVEYEEMEWV